MKTTILLLLFILIGSHVAQAQVLEEEVRAMRAEIQRLRAEVEELRREVRGSSSEELPLVQAQVKEQAQTKVETNSKFPMKVFGTIVSNTVWNSGEANWLDIPNLVASRPTGQPTGSFTSTMRQTRIGAILDGPNIGSLKSSAFLAVDFFGGIPNFSTGQTMGLPRLVYAYARVENNRTAFEIGQDHMILAPKNPTSLAAESFPLMYRSGNLYLRLPQIRGERVLATSGNAEFRVVGGIVAPVAGDFSSSEFQFVPPPLAGERSRTPGVQSRISWRTKSEDPYEKPKLDIGISGHYSRERYSSPGKSSLNPSWAAALDFDGTRGRFGMGGEFFVGKNIDAFGGSVAQLAKSRGGFIEGRFAGTPHLSFNGGYGTDRLFDFRRFVPSLSSNSSAFGNFIYQFTPEFAASMEYRWLGTRPIGSNLRRNNHLNLTFTYSF